VGVSNRTTANARQAFHGLSVLHRQPQPETPVEEPGRTACTENQSRRDRWNFDGQSRKQNVQL